MPGQATTTNLRKIIHETGIYDDIWIVFQRMSSQKKQ